MSEFSLLNREALFALDDLKKELIEIPEWQSYVYVRGMRGDERAMMAAQVQKSQQGDDKALGLMHARIAEWCAIDEQGARIFKPGDAVRLAEKAAKPLETIALAVLRLSGLDPQSMQEARKKLRSQSNASGTSLHSDSEQPSESSSSA